MDSNQRSCPGCGNTLCYSSEKSKKKADEKNQTCRSCMYSSREIPKEAKCPICNFVTKKLTTFAKHVFDTHNICVEQLWKNVNNNNGLCKCGCGNETSWKSWHDGYAEFIVGHNANIYAIYDKETAVAITKKRSDVLKGKEGWSKGLTKDSDTRIASRASATSIGRKKAFENKSITTWSKGLSKNSDQRLKNISDVLTNKYASGELKPWALGLTKKSDSRIAAMANKVAISHLNKNLRNRLDAIKRMTNEEIKSRIEARGTLEYMGVINDEYVNDNMPNVNVKCLKCGSIFVSSVRRLQHGRCYTCNTTGSAAQSELARWIESEGYVVNSCRRDLIDGSELDIFVPSHQLAIEYNGLYWHSILHKSSMYHENKSNACRSANIKLVHIFEDEWRDKRDIVKAMILHRLGKSNQKIFARKCTVKILSALQRKEFFNSNHIDGDVGASMTWGLISQENTIVACMSIRKPFHNKHSNCFEIARACCAKGYAVPGWLGRLTSIIKKYAIQNGHNELLSYVDLRFGDGHGWEKVGWKLIETSPPRFWWTDFENRFNRFKYKADKERQLTEAQVASEADVTKIWGCGNLVYKLQC